MILCPCDSQKKYSLCCQPFIAGEQNPQTPEALMRSRYAAYTQANMEYIKKTMRGKALLNFHEIEASKWAKKVRWIRLQVIHSVIIDSKKGQVEFEAIFREGSRLKSMHENSEFLFDQGLWYYVDGISLPPSYFGQRLSRNVDCPCGSKKKFKNCHGKNA